MQVSVEVISPVTKKISVEIPADQVDATIDKVYNEIRKRAKYEGFRPGKIPMHIVKRVYREAMLDQVMRDLYEKSIIKALQENNIPLLDTPAVEYGPIEEGTPFRYTAEVEVTPEIDLKDYLGITVNKEKFRPNPEAIEKEIRMMQESMSQLIPLDDDATVEKGHEVTIDYTFSIEGLPDEDKSEEDVAVFVGADQIAPGFDEQLIGMKIGEEKDIRVLLTEGADHNTEAAGKDGVYLVKLKEIKFKELPELDDEFAQQLGDYETMNELRAKMIEYYENSEAERIENDLNNNLVSALIERNPLEVPKSMVNSQMDYMMDNFKKQMQVKRIPFEKLGINDTVLRQRFHDDAVEKVKGQLLLFELMEKEKIDVSDEDLMKRFEKISSGNSDMLKRVTDYFSSNKEAMNSLRSEIRAEKALRFLQDNSVITEFEPVATEAA